MEAGLEVHDRRGYASTAEPRSSPCLGKCMSPNLLSWSPGSIYASPDAFLCLGLCHFLVAGAGCALASFSVRGASREGLFHELADFSALKGFGVWMVT